PDERHWWLGAPCRAAEHERAAAHRALGSWHGPALGTPRSGRQICSNENTRPKPTSLQIYLYDSRPLDDCSPLGLARVAPSTGGPKGALIYFLRLWRSCGMV